MSIVRADTSLSSHKVLTISRAERYWYACISAHASVGAAVFFYVHLVLSSPFTINCRMSNEVSITHTNSVRLRI